MNQTTIKNYVEYLRKIGYSEQTINAYSKALEQAPSTWNTCVPQELYEHINNTLKSKQEYFLPAARHNIKPASSLLFIFLTGVSFKNYSKQIIKSNSAYAPTLEEFFTYSTKFKHMTTLAAEAETHHISEFLNNLGGIPDDWAEITAENLRDYVCSKFSVFKPSTIGRYVTSLRNFFRFLEYKGYSVNLSVLSLPLAPANWGKSNTPVILSPDEELRIRNHYKSYDEINRRNCIIILLMLDLGLRCSEVSNLRMADIHWNSGLLHIRNTKNQHSRQLPISRELGELFEDYVINHRPLIKDEYLFLRRGLNNQYVYITGNSLKMTADILGHKSLDSTKQYVRVDFNQLREVASPWPGGDCNE